MRKYAPLLGIIAVFLWAGAFTAGKIAYQQLSTYELLFIRMTLSTLIFLPYLIWRTYCVGLPNHKTFLPLIALGFLAYPATLGFQFLGLQYTHASVASVAVGLEGTFTMILAYWVLKQKPTKSNWIVALMAFMGLLIVIGMPADANLVGVGLILCANVCAGAAIIVNKPLFKKMKALDIVGWSMALGTLMVVITSPYFGGIPEYNGLTNEVWWAIIAISLGSTVIAYVLHTICLQYLSATRTAQFIVLEPIGGVLAGVMILGEPLTLNIVLGACMVMGAILINSFIGDGH